MGDVFKKTPTLFAQEQINHFSKHQRVKEFSVHTAKVHSVAWNCDGHRLASGSIDKCVCLFSMKDRGLRDDHLLRGHADSIDQLCWHPSHPELLVTASADKTIKLWDARTNKFAASVDTKGENINITWSPDGSTIAVGNKEDLVAFVDVKTRQATSEHQFKFEVNEISWNHSGDLFFLTSGQGTVHVLNYPNLKPQMILSAHPTTCICIDFDKFGNNFAVGSADASVSLWDANELVCLRVYSRLEYPIRTLSFSHDGKMIASASEDHVIDIAEVETGEKIKDIACKSQTFSIAWHPKKALLAYACDDKLERDRDAGNVKLFGLPNE